MRYNVFITTGDNKIWSTTEVARAYGVRWSRLRREKSSFHMQALLHEQCTEEYRAQTIIYLLLLFICLFMQKVYLPAGRHRPMLYLCVRLIDTSTSSKLPTAFR